MKKIATMSVFAMLLLSSVIAVSEPVTEPSVRMEEPLIPQPMPDMIKIWEAYAKGWVNVTSEPDPLKFKVDNTGGIKINMNEMVMLLSPHPLQSGNPQTTQDGALTTGIVSPYSDVYYHYGENTVYPGPSVGEKPWWCTEGNQVVQSGATVVLGGEIAPYAIQELTKNPTKQTNYLVWGYLEENPTLVVGKTPLWKSVEDAVNHNIVITLAVTNLAVYYGPGDPDSPHAVDSVIEDTIPRGYSYVPGSIVPAPVAVLDNPDGSQTIRWKVDVNAADVSGHYKEDPTPYNTVWLTYTLVTPKLLVGRYFLPRAYADADHDGSNDSHSAKPLIEVYRVNKPPVANAGGPYEAEEGSDILLDASGSSDPNGDPLKYRWDLDDDGTWDTSWSSSPKVTMSCGDGPYNTDVIVEVSDGEMSGTATILYLCFNVAPTIDAITVQPSTVEEGQSFTVHVTFYDPGWLDTHTATIDWNDGQTSAPAVNEENQKPDATGDFSDSHIYGDDFSLGIRITVVDDDGGSDTVDVPLVVQNVDPTVGNFAYSVTVLEPRTQGYWNHQSNVTEPYGNHTGITDDLILFISSNSALFAYVSTEDDVCTVLEWASGEEIYYRAQGQLMALWLNTASGKLNFTTRVKLPGQNETILGDILAWAEDVLLSSTNESELEDVKTAADEINNGNYIAIGEILLSADVHDPGSDDIVVSVDWGDGSSDADTYFNDGLAPDPQNSPYGNYPFEVHMSARHSYWSEGSYSLIITVADDDGGETLINVTVDVYAP
ncbi:MAG: hypothetical protein KAW39_02040 [Thermoplasmata archaeon]|nr:hypothetical protein [Thermoplasmata archaeon]